MDLKDSVGQNCYSGKMQRQHKGLNWRGDTTRLHLKRQGDHMWTFCKDSSHVDRYLSVCNGNELWLNSQVMVAGGLEVTAQENLATEPSVTTTGTGCNTNSEIPVEKVNHQLVRDVAAVVISGCLYIYCAVIYVYYKFYMQSPNFDGCSPTHWKELIHARHTQWCCFCADE